MLGDGVESSRRLDGGDKVPPDKVKLEPVAQLPACKEVHLGWVEVLIVVPHLVVREAHHIKLPVNGGIDPVEIIEPVFRDAEELSLLVKRLDRVEAQRVVLGHDADPVPEAL